MTTQDLLNIKPKEISFPKKEIKTAIITFGTRFSPYHKHIRAVEVFWLRDYLMKVWNRTEVHVVTKLLKDEGEVFPYWKSIFHTDLNDYDEIIIQNSTHNFFGGVVNDYICETFNKLCQYKGDNIWYHYWDVNLNFVDFGLLFKYKIETNGYKFELPISIEDCEHFSTTIVPKVKGLYNGNDYEGLKLKVNSKGSKNIHSCELFTEYSKFNLPQFWVANIKDIDRTTEYPREYDVIYYGTKKGGRTGCLNKLFNKDNDLKKYWYGYDPEYPNTKVETKYIPLNELYNEVHKCYGVIIVGDPKFYYGKVKAMRVYEVLNLDVIGFIHKDYVEEDFFKNKELENYIVFSTIDDLKRTLEKVKKDKSLFDKIIEWQKEEFKRLCGDYKLKDEIPTISLKLETKTIKGGGPYKLDKNGQLKKTKMLF